MSMNVIALDHPISVNGITLRFIPVRAPDRDDCNEATRLSLRKRCGERIALTRMLKPFVAKDDMQKAILGLALIKRITSLPFSAVVQIEDADQRKFADFIAASLQEASRG